MKDYKFDVIIIGAGIGGLICGCFLAKAGFNVLIVEQNTRAGGCVSAIKIKDCTFDMGAHLFGSCNKEGILGQCLSLLGVDIDFIRLVPADRFTFPDDIIEVPDNFDEYESVLIKKFPCESKNIINFFKEVFWIAQYFTKEDVISKYQDITYQQLLDKYFHDARLKGILSAQYLYIGSKPQNSSLLFMAVLLRSYLKDGIYYPKGGTQIFPDTLNRRFTEYGGTSLFNMRVKKILIESKKKVKGIELHNGTRYLSDIVISNGDAEETFFELIGEENVSYDYIRKIKNYIKSSSLFHLFLSAKKNKKSNFDISKQKGWYFNSYDMNDAAPLYIFIPTNIDSSLAPPDVDIVQCLMEFPSAYDDIVDWTGCKKNLQEEVLVKIEKIFGSIRENICYIDSATPDTFRKFTMNSKGAIYGWEMSVDQVAKKRLQPETTFENLFLVGHWTVPGCGIPSVAVSGWRIAQKIINEYIYLVKNVQH